MMTVMQIKSTRPGARRATQSRKEATHDRIVEVAARAIRRSGYAGTGVADIMKEAGLTHGGFYAHFDSRDTLLAEAADSAGADAVSLSADIAAAAAPGQSLQAMMQAYLSQQHLEDVENGCPIAALGSEMHRQAPKVRHAATRHIKAMIDMVARQLPDWGTPGAHEQAMFMVSSMVGTMVMARAVDDPRLSAELREAALKHFSEAGK
jgi:TetR/AcrR family transcriptional repressor of nem operon